MLLPRHRPTGKLPYCDCKPGWTSKGCTVNIPLSSKPKAVITYLVYGAGAPAYALQLATVLPLLDRYFNDRCVCGALAMTGAGGEHCGRCQTQTRTD